MHKEMDKVRRKFRIKRADLTYRASNNIVLTETGNQLLKFYKKQAEKVISNYDSVMDKTEEKMQSYGKNCWVSRKKLIRQKINFR